MHADGCAIYFKPDRLKMIEHVSVEYHQPGIDILDRHNVAIIAKFAPLDNLQEEFLVATTHLLYNPKREDIRLAQVQVLLTEIERIAFKRINEKYPEINKRIHKFFLLIRNTFAVDRTNIFQF